MNLTAAAICLALGTHHARLPVQHFTLSWMHSVEKTQWQEDYTLRGDRLVLTEARLQGTGAGMEPPPDAVLRGRWWHYVPHLPPLPELRLTLSPYTADYKLCWRGQCHALATMMGVAKPEGVVIVRACAPAR